MAVKDSVVAWFFLHYVMPRSQIIDKPGFVVFKVSQKTDIYSRQVVLPESLYVSIEKHFAKRFGKTGKQALYSAGKRFGYRFAQVSHVAKINDSDEKAFLGYVKLLSKFVEGTYASSLSHSVDLESKTIRFNMKNFVICRESGMGYLISVGGIAGIWSLMACDPEIEASHPRCQGRGDPECEVIAAPVSALKKHSSELLTETSLENLSLDRRYRSINSIKPVLHAKNSLKSMIDTRFFEFHNGILTYNGHRYFIAEESLNYLIENELKKLKGGKDDLFRLSSDYGRTLTEKQKIHDPCRFITEFMSALGWGDVMTRRKAERFSIRVTYFPWTKWSDDSEFIIFRGIVSGMISGIITKKVVLNNLKKKISAGNFIVECSE